MSKKFPRTPHLPWSPGGTNDDKRLGDVKHFLNKEIIISEKVDGSNLCFTNKEVYARTHAVKATHKSFDLAKQIHAKIKNSIEPNISVFGEFCYAVHSIEYDKLPDYFLAFGVRDDDTETFYSWDKVEDYISYLGLFVVRVLYRGIIQSEETLKSLTTDLATQKSEYGEDKREGIVIRLDGEFKDFYNSVAKWVRADHPKDIDEHWLFKSIKKQGLIY